MPAREIACSHVDVTIVPASQRKAVDLRVWSPDEQIATYLEELGYEVAAHAADAQLLVARTPSAVIERHVRDGARLLIVADRPVSLQPLFPHWQNVRVLARDETPWRGDWASSFSWLRRAGPFADIPGPKLLDMRFDRILPAHVIAGCNLLDFQARVHAGIVVGWIHKAAAMTVERTYGKGHFAVTTFRLFRDPPGQDPMATLLIARHIALANKPSETSMTGNATAHLWR